MNIDKEAGNFGLRPEHLIDRVVMIVPAIVGDVLAELEVIQAITELAVATQFCRVKMCFQISQFLLRQFKVFLLARFARVIPLVHILLDPKIGFGHGATSGPELEALFQPSMQLLGFGFGGIGFARSLGRRQQSGEGQSRRR